MLPSQSGNFSQPGSTSEKFPYTIQEKWVGSVSCRVAEVILKTGSIRSWNVLYPFCLMSFWLGAQGGEVITAYQSLQLPVGARITVQWATLQGKVGALLFGTAAAVH